MSTTSIRSPYYQEAEPVKVNQVPIGSLVRLIGADFGETMEQKSFLLRFTHEGAPTGRYHFVQLNGDTQQVLTEHPLMHLHSESFEFTRLPNYSKFGPVANSKPGAVVRLANVQDSESGDPEMRDIHYLVVKDPTLKADMVFLVRLDGKKAMQISSVTQVFEYDMAITIERIPFGRNKSAKPKRRK